MNEYLTSKKEQQLRYHKRLATGLFIVMACTYIAMVWFMKHQPAAWMGYVKAFSEAAMVGALADWFAVTALFHHPLGLPIPHTNLIEKSKQRIGDNLGEFIVSNFLTAQNIRPYITQLALSNYIAHWLTTEKNKHLLLTELAQMLRDVVRKLDDEMMIKVLVSKGGELLQRVELNKVVANAFGYFLDKKEHQVLITLLASKIKDYIGNNRSLVRDKVKDESYFFIPKFIDEKLADKITSGIVRYFFEVEQNPNHHLRAEIEQQLRQFILDIQSLPKWKATFDELKSGLVDNGSMEQYATDVWYSVKASLFTELENEHSGLFRYAHRLLDEFSENLQTDEQLRQRIDRWIRVTVYRFIMRNRTRVGYLVSDTVGNWEGRTLSQKLELEVGKDLQYIRINGTLVGGLVGLAIYAITQLLN
jgi:uncharacterized membrane-anchored protein YjiN (DUF445 family)